jgi:protein SCO1/2
MKRRIFLGSLAAAGTAGTLGGCLGLASDSHSNVTMGQPKDWHDGYDPQYLNWDEQLPGIEIPAPLESKQIALRNVDTPSVVTFFYSHCKTICPILISTLRNVQTHALNNGYGDKVTFLPITFDPARDDAKRLRTYAKNRNIAYKKDDWHFLRPSEKRVKQFFKKQFGFRFSKTKQNDGKKGYMFTHRGLILLTNADGYVERAYTGRDPPQKKIIKDLKKLR